MQFQGKCSERIRLCGNHLCVGIDPHRQAMSPFFTSELQRIGSEKFLLKLTSALLEGASGAAAVKFQSAFFEAFGSPGVSVLESAVQDARKKGFLTILDAKRGDISSTMQAYGEAAFERMGADALTVTAYMGTDVLEALKPWGLKGFGAYVVWISSNPSGAELQNARLEVNGDAVDETVADKLQQAIDNWEQRAGATGMIGYVLGVTKIDSKLVDKINRVERCFLMPGVGAQGGKIDELLLSILKRHPSTLVTMSRTLTGLGDPNPAWQSIASWEAYLEAVKGACNTAKTDLRFAR